MIEFAAYKLLENFSDETLSKVELFSTQFYTKLIFVPTFHSKLSKVQQSHKNVARWTKGKNVFGKKIHFYPINEELTHWYLIIVVFPDISKGFDPYVAVLDSVGGKKDAAVDNLKNYLIEELKQKNTTFDSANDNRNMETVYPNIPTQLDGSSCGLYVLHYIEQILTGLEEKCLSAVFDETSNWFRDDIDKKRFEISRLIMNTSNSYANSSKITFPELQFFPTAAEDKCEKRKELEKKETNKVDEGYNNILQS